MQCFCRGGYHPPARYTPKAPSGRGLAPVRKLVPEGESVGRSPALHTIPHQKIRGSLLQSACSADSSLPEGALVHAVRYPVPCNAQTNYNFYVCRAGTIGEHGNDEPCFFGDGSSFFLSYAAMAVSRAVSSARDWTSWSTCWASMTVWVSMAASSRARSSV